MIEGYRKNTGRFSLVIILLLLAVFIWSLVFNSQWRQALYTYFKEASLRAPTETGEDTYQPPRELTITYFDVGQGLAHLIQIPSGKVILYDAGEGMTPDYKYSRYRGAGARAILPVLRAEGIKKIDVIVASHPHSDHIGGFLCILDKGKFEVGGVLDPGVIHPTPTYKSFLAWIKEQEVPYQIVRDGDILNWGPDVFVQVLSPPDRLWECANENSIVIMLIYGKTRFLFTGDIEKNAINRLINEYGPRIRADVIQVPHHGSNTSNCRNFITLVGASYAITSGSGGQPFGHPTPETEKRWKESGADVYHIHQNGNITVISDGENIRVKTVR